MDGTAPVDAVIFDLDGVLVDSEAWWDEVRAEFARAHDRPWSADDRDAVMGANSRQWAATIRERLALNLPADEIQRAVVDGVLARYAREPAPTIDGVAEAVRRIAAHRPVAIASSSHPEVIEAALRSTGLAEVFAVVVSSDEVEHGKPAPDVYLEAARRLSVSPERVVVFEDSINGVRAARSAGMRVVLVPSSSIPPAPGAGVLADAVVGRISDLDPATLGAVATRSAASDRATPDRTGGPAPELPGPPIHPWRRTVRYWLSRTVVWLLARAYIRLRVEGRERLPAGPAVYCFNHLNWADPFVLMATLPFRPRLYFFGPKEENMSAGGRNRLMLWTGTAVPYRPGKNDLLEATRRVRAVFAAGGVLAIAGEGRIHAGEAELLPLNEGAAYFALRSGVPIVPLAINGTSWLRLGRRVRVRIGQPIATSGRPTREAVAALTEETWGRLHDLVADHPDYRPPGPVGRWLTELFNDWPEGERPPTSGILHGRTVKPDP
ncbi:MAG TPA: HAD-IA family hydrolase [Candidatus Limnocylindrales bacterium]|nr:HAD-IA family hydrolase [Candidatus Limnocylindrales bacterium]